MCRVRSIRGWSILSTFAEHSLRLTLSWTAYRHSCSIKLGCINISHNYSVKLALEGILQLQIEQSRQDCSSSLATVASCMAHVLGHTLNSLKVKNGICDCAQLPVSTKQGKSVGTCMHYIRNPKLVLAYNHTIAITAPAATPTAATIAGTL